MDVDEDALRTGKSLTLELAVLIRRWSTTDIGLGVLLDWRPPPVEVVEVEWEEYWCSCIGGREGLIGGS